MGTPRTIARTLTETFYYATQASVDRYGSPTFGTAASFLGRHELDSRTLRYDTGQERELTHVIYTATEVPVGSIVWLPDEDETDTDEGHQVELLLEVPSLAVRGTQWTLWEVRF